GLEGVNPGIDLPDLALRRGGVFLLDYACNLLADPDNTPVAGWIVDDGGDDGGRCAAGQVRADELHPRVGRQERDVARQQYQDAGRALKRRFGLKQRVRRPKLWLL